MCWLDDEFLVSGSRDTKLALWRITPDVFESTTDIPTHQHIPAVCIKECKNSQKVIMRLN